MNTERPKELLDSPKHIAGIYNYCDHWCERCPFTSRCAQYAMDTGLDPEQLPDDTDMTDHGFWRQLQEVFDATLELVRESAEEQGIDLEDVCGDACFGDIARMETEATKHPCCTAAREYIGMVDRWFSNAESLLERNVRETTDAMECGLPHEAARRRLARTNENVEIVRWYQRFIYVKMRRAVDGRQLGAEEAQSDEQKDWDGSAKIALIAIQRSIAAWGALRAAVPEHADEIIDLLVHLDRLHRAVDKAFPAARSFVRPGFDTENGA